MIKLDPAQVRRLRSLRKSRIPQKILGKIFNIHQSQVSKTAARVCWWDVR